MFICIFVFICLLITLFIFASLDDTYLFRLGYFYKNLPDVQSWLGSEGVRCLYLYCYDDVEYCCCVGDTACRHHASLHIYCVYIPVVMNRKETVGFMRVISSS